NHQLAIDHCWQVMNSATGTPYENLFKGKAYNNLGYAYFELGDYQKAEQYLTQSLNYTDRGDTFVAATYNNLGSVYNKLGNHTKASACFQKSVELNQHKVDMEELIFTFNSIRSLPEVKSNNDSLIYYMDLFAAIAAPIIASKESLETKDLRYRLEGLELAENEKASRETIPLWVLVCTIAVLLLSVLFLYFRVRFQLNRRSSDMRKFDEYMKIKQKENAEWMKKIKKDQDMLLS
ncbi:tetratricopeptide repeat protein, partial [Reichenbachiella sp.]